MSRVESIAIVFGLAATACFAQLTGRLTGTVTDPTGSVVPNANVSLLLPGGKNALLTTKTDAAGVFDFSAVRPDTYTLVVEHDGFTKYMLEPVKVDPARQQALPAIKLTLAGTAQQVEVLG